MKTRTTILTPLAVIAAVTLCLAVPQRLFAHGDQIEMGGGGGPVKLTKEQQAAIGLKTAKAELRDIDARADAQRQGETRPEPSRARQHAHRRPRREALLQRG